MDFTLSEDQQLLRDNAQKQGARIVNPTSRARDKSGEWNPAIWKQMGDCLLYTSDAADE